MNHGAGMTIIPLPTADIPLAASKALADDKLSDELKGILRQLLSTDDDERVKAMSSLVGFEVDEGNAEYSEADVEQGGPLDDDSAIRILPALVALAAVRDDAERFSLVTCAANLELNRLLEEIDVPAGLDQAFADARATAISIAGAALSQPIDEEELLRPLMMVVSVFNGHVDVAMSLLGLDDEYVEGEDDEDGDDEEADA